MKTRAENLWETLKTTNDWIKVSDAKAVAIISLQSVFLGFLLSQSIDEKFEQANWWFSYTILVCAIILNGISIAYSFCCVNPRLRLIGGISPIYFGTIAEKFNNSAAYKRFFSEKFDSESEIEEELAGQVYVNSTIAWRKFKNVAYSIRSLVASLALWGVYILVLIFT